jgi:hypothetical protein
MSLYGESEVTYLEDTLRSKDKGWAPFLWCLPSLLGFLAFVIAFPIDRRVPFWPHLSLVDLFILWFLFVAPVTTVISIVALLRRRRTGRMLPLVKTLTWVAIAVSIAVNAFVLLGMWAAIYF